MSCTKPRFDMLQRAETLQLSIDENADSTAQSFAFFQRMCREQNRRVASFDGPLSHIPHESFGKRVHSCRRFVQQHDCRSTQQSERRLQFAFVASAQIGRRHIPELAQLHGGDRRGHRPTNRFGSRKASNPRVHLNMLRHRHLVEQRICLLYTSPSPRDRQKSRMPSSA